MQGEITGHHWAALLELLPIYRAITIVQLGDGETTSWFDVWNGQDTLADRFPALISHCTKTELTLCELKRDGLGSTLVQRLSSEALAELTEVDDILAAWLPTDQPDKRLSPFADDDGKLHTSQLYKMLQSAQCAADPVAAFVWRNRAPPRVQFFAWLLVRERIQSRENLKRRKVLEDAACEICASADETAAHIMFECEFAKSFWAALHIDLPSLMTTAKLSELVPPQHIPAGHFDSFLLLCCWQLWKRRNNAVFRQQLDPLGAVMRAARDDARSWGSRLPQKDLHIGLSWCSVIESAM